MVHINTSESPFQRTEAHFSETAYFDELAKEGEVAAARSRGVPLSILEDLEVQ